jgi:tetratricopeptide (TPR) repeat protein
VYSLTQALPSLQVPATVQAVLAARIDRLPPEGKRLLQAAAVIGKYVPFTLLQTVAKQSEEAIRRSLAQLQAAEFLYETSLFPELEYTFKHALTQEVAYESLPQGRRRALHARIVEGIEALYPDHLAEQVERLAHHALQGEVLEKALTYLVKAGQKAQQAYANREALAQYERAVEVCARLGGTVEPTTLMTLYAGKGAVHFLLSEVLAAIEAYQQMLELARQSGDRAKEAEALYQIGFASFRAHQFEKVPEFANRAKALALEIGDRKILAGSLLVLGQLYAITGKLDEASQSFEEALRISQEAGDRGTEGFNLYFLGFLHNLKGEYAQARQLEEQAVAIAYALDLQLNIVRSLWIRGLICCGQGEYEQAIASLQEGLALSERLGETFFKCRILNTLGWVYSEIYNLEPAIHYNRQGAEAASPTGDPEIIRNAEINLGDAYLLLDDLEQAQQYLEKVHREAQQHGKWGEEWMKWRYAQHLYHSLGELWLIKGDGEKALRFAEECLQLAEPTDSRKNLVKGWRLKGQVFSRQGRRPDAAAALQKALAIAKEIGNPPQLWKTYHALGELYEREGDADRARAAYASAIQVIEEVAGRLHDQALRGLFLAARPVQEIRRRLHGGRNRSGACVAPTSPAWPDG